MVSARAIATLNGKSFTAAVYFGIVCLASFALVVDQPTVEFLFSIRRSRRFDAASPSENATERDGDAPSEMVLLGLAQQAKPYPNTSCAFLRASLPRPHKNVRAFSTGTRCEHGQFPPMLRGFLV